MATLGAALHTVSQQSTARRGRGKHRDWIKGEKGEKYYFGKHKSRSHQSGIKANALDE